MFGLFGGSALMNEIADEIGIDRAIFKAALTEAGVNFAFFKKIHTGLAEHGGVRQANIDIGVELLLPALQGLKAIESKFPSERSVGVCREALLQFGERVGIIKD